MSAATSLPGPELPREQVLTLAEAAAYLRVSEQELARLAGRDGVPARQVGGQWRFLKSAVDAWLRGSPEPTGEGRLAVPSWLAESPRAEELLLWLEDRLLLRLKQAAQASPRPGSKQAVLRNAGVFRDDADLPERLADARARREAG